jgi:hypothetical protein
MVSCVVVLVFILVFNLLLEYGNTSIRVFVAFKKILLFLILCYPLLITADGAPYTFTPQPEEEEPLDLQEVVKEKLAGWDKRAPLLETFIIDDIAAFKPYWKETGVPNVPVRKSKKPSLILHDLENTKHMHSDGYKYIDLHQKSGPIALYGTSGAGKTRTIFEYLSHNYGFYLTAGADDLYNPGSKDVVLLIDSCKKTLQHILSSDSKREQQSVQNLQSVRNSLEKLLRVRQSVFDHIDETLKSNRHGKGLSCHEWLLLQLFPNAFLGFDVFRDVFRDISGSRINVIYSGAVMQMSCFLDEAQVLVGELKGSFLSSDGTKERSAYSAFLKGLTSIQLSGHILYPCFSGTGMSIDAYKAESKSLMNKPTMRTHRFFFAHLKTFAAKDVIDYIKTFLNLEKVGLDLVQHVGEWLKGRPRWTATFVETYIENKETNSSRSLRGRFKHNEERLIKSLNRYIEICTSRKDDERRLSWNLGDRSAFSAISKMFEKSDKEWSEVKETFRRSIFEFSLSGQGQPVKIKAAMMIEAGVASVDTGSDETLSNAADDYILAKICEPLIVQAGITYFGLTDFTSEKLAYSTSDAEKGKVFEQFLLPSIQNRFEMIMTIQLPKDSYLQNYKVPEWSSYGVLATKCEDPSGTIAWINAVMESRFEGAIPPFCFPDNMFGPDVVFLLRNRSWDEFRLVAIQAKLKKHLNQAQALRTVVPELFYHQNRGKNPSSSLKEKSLQDSWNTAEKKLFGIEDILITGRSTRASVAQPTRRKRNRDMVRVVVQYPAEQTASANPGPIAFTKYKATKDCNGKCDCLLHDNLIVVDGQNAEALFGSTGVKILSLVKLIEARK